MGIGYADAQAIVRKHVTHAKVVKDEYFDNHEYTATEKLAHAVILFSKYGFTKKMFDCLFAGVEIQLCQNDEYIFICEGEAIGFKNLKPMILNFDKVFKPNKSFQNTLFASADIDSISDGDVCTALFVDVDLSEHNIPECLHSFVQLDDHVLDFTLGISMPTKYYNQIFKIQILSRIKVEDVKREYQDGTINEMLNVMDGMNLPTYLLAREDCLDIYNRFFVKNK